MCCLTPSDVLLNQNEQATLHLIKQFSHHFSESCPETIKTSLTYSANLLKKLQTTKVGEMKGHPILNIFKHLDDNVEVTWAPEYPYLDKVLSSQKSFSWGEVNLISFESTESSILAKFADESTKIGTFSCSKNSNSRFLHLLEPVDNTLDYHNFALAECENMDGLLWIENDPIQVGMGNVEYVDILNKSQHKNISDTALLVFTPYNYHKAMLTLNGFPFYLQKALADQQGKIITLVGEVRPTETQGTIRLGECVNYYSQLKLTHFSDKQVDISVFDHENWESMLQTNKTPICELKQVSYQIEIFK